MKRQFAGNSRGQSLVEFALILPIVVALLMGVFDIGRVVWANDVLSNAAREAARYAIVHGGARSNPCPVGPPDLPDTVVPAASASCPYPSPSKQAIVDVASKFAIAGGRDVTVQVCYGPDCSGDTDVPGATNRRGTPITVTITSSVDMSAAGIVGWKTFTVSSSSTMLVNN
jgi:hypothetical protein